MTAKWLPFNYFCYSNSLKERQTKGDRLKTEFLPPTTLLRALSRSNVTEEGKSPFHPHVIARFDLGNERKDAPLFSSNAIISVCTLGGLLLLSIILYSINVFRNIV